MTLERDQAWLEARLAHLWERGFSDVERGNEIVIKYGRKARTRLGSIRMSRDKRVSTILVNRLFQLPEVPLAVIDATIAHELVHYAHGFSSPLPQKYKTAHAGGVVTKELLLRGFTYEHTFEKRWTKQHWHKLLRVHAPRSTRRRPRRRRTPAERLARRVVRLLS